MTEKFVEFKKGKIAYFEKSKEKKQTLVFLHGFLENKEMWKYFTEVLSKKYRIVAIDLPGHGGSESFGYVHTMELMAESVKAVMNHLKLRKYFLIGHSMGGYIALAFAEKYPDNLKGLCLFHSSAAGDTSKKKKDRERAIEIVKENLPLYVNSTIKNLFSEKSNEVYKKEVNKLIKRAEKMNPQGVIAALKGMKDRLEREIVIRFAPFPVFFIVGMQDKVFDIEKILEQTQIPRHKDALILEEASHMGFIENKFECIAALDRFAKMAFN